MKRYCSIVLITALMTLSLQADEIVKKDDFEKLNSYFNTLVNSDFMKNKLPNIKAIMNFPKMNMSENNNSYEITFDVAGVNKSDIKLSVVDNKLIIEGKKKENNNGKNSHYLYKEIYEGAFKREVLLPQNANLNKISSQYSEGLLKVNIAKIVQTPVTPKLIKIN